MAEDWLATYNQYLSQAQQQPQQGVTLDSLFAPTPNRAMPAPGISPMQPPAQPKSYLAGFVQSALQSGLGDMVGKPSLTPSVFGGPEDVQQFRDANPIGNVASQIVGAIPTMALGVGEFALAAKALPWLARAQKALAAGSEIAKARPILAPALQTALELTPFEATRIGTAALVADEGKFNDVVTSAALDMALTPAIPAGWAAIKQLRPVRVGSEALKAKFPDFDVTASFQEQLQTLSKIKSTIDPTHEALPDIDNAIYQLQRRVLADRPQEGGKYVSGLADGGDAAQINRLFKTESNDPTKPILRQRFGQAKDGFPTFEEGRQALYNLGIDDAKIAQIEFPRQVEAKTARAARDVQKTIGSNLQSGPEGWFLKQEPETGLFVMARKVNGGPKAGEGDKWLLFKAADPEQFIPKGMLELAQDRAVKFTRGAESAINREALEKLSEDSLVGVTRRFANSIPYKSWKKVKGDTEKIWSLLPEQFRTAGKEMGEDVSAAWQYVKGRLSPAMHQFKGKDLAEYVRLRAQNIADAAQSRTASLSFGDQGLGKDLNMFKSIFSNSVKDVGGVEGLVMNGLKNEDMPYITSMWKAQMGIDDIKQVVSVLDGEQGKRIVNLFEKLAEIDAKKVSERQLTESLYGIKPFEPLENHYGISHMWKGPWRQEVHDAKNKLVAMGSGQTEREAYENGLKLAEQVGGIVKERPFASSYDRDVALADRLFANNQLRDSRWNALGRKPKIDEIRKDIPGFIGDMGEALTKEELAGLVKQNIAAHYRYLGETIAKHELMPDMLAVRKLYGDEVFNQLVDRVNRMFGKKGALDKYINKGVDQVLGRALGNNSADKIVGAINQFEYHLTQMAGSFIGPALNTMTALQTVIPKIALIRGATPEMLAQHMGFMPDIGPNGLVSGFRAFLEAPKIAGAAFKEMARGDELMQQMFRRAASESVIAPRFIEEYVGQNSLFGRGLKDALLEGKNPFVSYIKKLSEYPMAKTEELARTHAFATGKILAKDMMGITDPEQIYQFAKQFTFRTMYQYSSADRPKIFTGPVGQLMGLFKNWMFHNIGDFAEYTGEAVKRGNFGPLVWAMAGTGALAGVAGLPLYGVADGVSRILTDKRLMDHIYEGFGVNGGDAIYYGLPGLMGLSLQGSASGPFSNPLKDMTFLTNMAALDRAGKIAKFFQNAGSLYTAGENPFQNPRTWDLAMYAFAPKTMYKAFAQVQDGALKAIKDGNPIIEGISPGEWALNTLSLTPTRIARAYEVSGQLWEDLNAQRARVASYADAFAQAMKVNDQVQMTALMSRAFERGIDLSAVLRSANQRLVQDLRPSLDFDFRAVRNSFDRTQLYDLSSFR